jgi:hypothetical protein
MNGTQTQTQVFVVSINYNSLGGIYTTCPERDHRTPPIIDLFNAALKTACADSGMPYIDLNPVMGPMWDSAFDWCHARGKVFFAEIEYVLSSIFQHSLLAHQGVSLSADHSWKLVDNTVVRFSGSDRSSRTVYLYNKGEVRAFPDGHTFAAMGFEFDAVQTLEKSKRTCVKFGSELPPL